jgi:hypothetical protein
MPVVEKVILTDSATITFTGKNFFTTGYTGKARFNGIVADELTVKDGTTAVAKWNKGIPVTTAVSVPELWFVKSGGRRMLTTTTESPLEHHATNTLTLENPLKITASTSGLSCSFAGGCNYEVSAKGLSTLLKNRANNQIQVCGKTCDF